MKSIPPLAEVLQQFVRRSTYTPDQLARLSGIPKATIVNWLEGHVKKPRGWQYLASLSSALHLTEVEATQVLQAGGYPSVVELLALASSKADIDLLSPWAEAAQMRFNQAPFQAIADLAYFVGREQILHDLKAALLAGRHVTLYSLEGMPGVGKTVVAAHLAYQLRPFFPDGVLWARLDTSDTMSILSAFANAYGRDVSRYTDVESRSQVVREVLASKRAIMVLDNAQHSEEVKPLLPPTGTCAVIVTTRRHDLSVSRSARRFLVDVFDRDAEEAFGLFVKVLGEQRAWGERAPILELAELLGHLPLAVDIAASRLAYEPDWSVSSFLDRIRQEKGRLSQIVYENQSILSSFNISFKMLSPELQRFFAVIGVFEGDDFGIDAVAYVAATELDVAEDALRTLFGLSLVQRSLPRRYRLHPLLRDFARTELIGLAAYERMVRFFVSHAEDHETDHDAIAIEASNIHGALRTAFDKGMWELLVRGTNAFCDFLDTKGLYGQAELHLERANHAARSLGDTAGLTMTFLFLGEVAERRGDYNNARKHWLEGLRLARESGGRGAISTFLQDLGTVAIDRGELALAEDLYKEGLELAREDGDRQRMSALLQGMGVVAAKHGDYPRAEEMYQEALTLAWGIGRRDMVTALLTNLGLQACRRGDYLKAEEIYRQALDLAREVGYRELICYLLINQIDLPAYRNDYAQAQRQLHEALDLAREIEHPERIAAALTALGWVAVSFQDYTRADSYLRDALVLAREIGDLENVGFALVHISAVEVDHGKYERAEEYLQEALDLGRTMENRLLIGMALNAWGELHLKQQQFDQAQGTFVEALQLAQQLGLAELLADAKYGLARLAAIHSDVQDARREGLESLQILKRIRHHKALEVERWVASLPPS